ncbi:MAG: tRNA glutamyl-Q(34) synthetase GluQRS [Hyphomicrobiaceae bacterium]
MQPVLRFAPSPTGYLHLGHVRSAMIGHRLARRMGGRFLLRIEDTDLTRCRPEYEAAIVDDLAWLGLDWDGPMRRQSDHLADYQFHIDRLARQGLLYPCFATRREIVAAAAPRPAALDPDGAPIYPGLHRGLGTEEIAQRQAAGEPFALRLDMAKSLARAAGKLRETPLAFASFEESGDERHVLARPQDWGDVVIVRKETGVSYHLAVVVDDALQGVTHVTRGADLERATDLHRLLQVLLDLPAPRYHHHPLIFDASGRKLAKRDGAEALRTLRSRGATPGDVRRLAGV